jgi:hypothetical protein
MVSPPYKEGTQFLDANIFSQRGAISEDGSHLIDFSLGAFAETKSQPFENTVYELSRVGSSWATTALSPPGALSPEANFFGASKDLSKTLWGLHSPERSIREENLYIREPDGAFVEVGPMVPPARASGPPAGTTTGFGRSQAVKTVYSTGGGSSADLSHILVSVEGGAVETDDRWPGDGTLAVAGHSADSLYEYSGTGLGRPELVGVGNEGKQISQCGTDLGLGTDVPGELRERYNAISASGKIVFFTAEPGGCAGLNPNGEGVIGEGPPVKDLYARIDGKETLNISEPSSALCLVCRTGHTTTKVTEEPAFFAGASEDGSKVFFMTEQELLAGRTTNNLYELDFDNSSIFRVLPVALGSNQPEVQGVMRVSEDGSHVYFVAKAVLTTEPRGGVGGPCYAELTPVELAEEETGKKEGKCRPQTDENNLYVFVRDAAHPLGDVKFIANIAGDAREGETTPDGRYLVFLSTHDLTSDDTSTVSQIFEYDAREELLVRVSKGQCVPATLTTCAAGERFNDNGNTSAFPTTMLTPNFEHFDGPAESESRLSVSNDGAYVVFDSANDLTPAAETAREGDAESVYEYHSIGAIDAGNVYLISNGTDVTQGFGSSKGDQLFGEDAAGGDVFFGAGASLLSSDTNEGEDIYDARIGGGFPEPAASAECVGEECQGPALDIARVGAMSSTSASPGGDLTAGAARKPQIISGPRHPPSAASKVLARRRLGIVAMRACRRYRLWKKRAACMARIVRDGNASGAKAGSRRNGRRG